MYGYIAPQPAGLEDCSRDTGGRRLDLSTVQAWPLCPGMHSRLPRSRAVIITFAGASYGAAVDLAGWPADLVGSPPRRLACQPEDARAATAVHAGGGTSPAPKARRAAAG